MFTAVLWKEYREHRSVWLALAVVACCAVAGTAAVLSLDHLPGRGAHPFLGMMTLIFAWTYGVVCGAMLLAGEREGHTQPFLDLLPAPRLTLWWYKCVAGGLFLILHLVVLATLGIALNVSAEAPVLGILLLLAVGLGGYGWGLFFSSHCQTPLGAIGLAILVQLVVLSLLASVVSIGVGILVLLLHEPFWVSVISFGLGILVAIFAPLLLSSYVYARSDWQRRVWQHSFPVTDWLTGGRQLLWLAWHQTRSLAVGLCLFALAGGFVAVLQFPLIWALVTLLLGVLCGVTAFLDEQQGPARFLGDQRFPLTGLWLVKLALRFAVLVAACFLVLFPSVIFHSLNEGAHAPPTQGPLGRVLIVMTSTGLYFFLWPIHGFAIGHLCGLLFRKPMVAIVVATGATLVTASLWVPSLIADGVHPWQVLAVPVVLLCAARRVLRPWATDRLMSWNVAQRLIVAGFLCLALTALALWMRVVEIPLVAIPEGYKSFVADLPESQDNETGRQIRVALEGIEALRPHHGQQPPPAPIFPEEADDPNHTTFSRQAMLVNNNGWPDGEPALGKWLDTAFEAQAWANLASIPKMPLGLVEDPRRLNFFSPLRATDSARFAGTLLAARGLQMQKANGEPAVFAQNLEVSLALVRNLQNKAPSIPALVARAIEREQLLAVEQWLKQLGNDSDLLKRVLTTLVSHRESLPLNHDQNRDADALVARNSLERPEEWLKSVQPVGWSDYDTALIDFSWRLPWERARLERQMNHLHFSTTRTIPQASPWIRHVTVPPAPLERDSLRRRCVLDATILMVALRLYEAQKGEPAKSLEPVIKDYLPFAPLDPFSGKPFGYRLSKGEKIAWPEPPNHGRGGMGAAMPGGGGPPGLDADGGAAGGMAAGAPGGEWVPPEEPTRTIAAGQGILWSVGEDRQDGGGKRQAGNTLTTQGEEDIVFVVPLPAKKK